MHNKCSLCKNADSTVTFSNWHYCSDPTNFREFTIIRHRDDFSGDKINPVLPIWCPYKKEHND